MWNNSNYSVRYEEIDGARAWFQASVAVCWTFAALVPAFNIAVIVTILKYRKPSRLYFLLLNMAVADLLTGVFDTLVRAIELTAGYQILLMPWSAGSQACKLQRSFANACAMASNFLLATTSLDRALVIAKPMTHFKRGFIRHKVFTAACWMISICGSIPLYISFHIEEIPGKDIVVCHHDIAVFPFCGAYTCAVWCVIYRSASGCRLQLPLADLVLLRRTEGSIYVNGSSSGQEPRPFRVFNTCLPRSKLRSIQLMCGIVSAWFPFFTVVYMNTYADFRHPSLMVLLLSYYLNPLVNPVVFFLFHRLRLQRSTLSLYSGTTPLKFLGESRHVRFSTMRNELQVNDDRVAIRDTEDQEETVFCEITKSIVIDENGIDDEKRTSEN